MIHYSVFFLLFCLFLFFLEQLMLACIFTIHINIHELQKICLIFSMYSIHAETYVAIIYFFFFKYIFVIFNFLLFADNIQTQAGKGYVPQLADNSDNESQMSQIFLQSMEGPQKRKRGVLSDDDDYNITEQKKNIQIDSDYFTQVEENSTESSMTMDNFTLYSEMCGMPAEARLNENDDEIENQSENVTIASPEIDTSKKEIIFKKKPTRKISDKPRLCKNKKVPGGVTKKRKKNDNLVLAKLKNCNKSPLGQVLSDPTQFEVTKIAPKKYACPYCNKIYSDKLVDHLVRKHKDEPKVIEIMRLPVATLKLGQSLN